MIRWKLTRQTNQKETEPGTTWVWDHSKQAWAEIVEKPTVGELSNVSGRKAKKPAAETQSPDTRSYVARKVKWAKSGWKLLAAGTSGVRVLKSLVHRSKAHEVSVPRTADIRAYVARKVKWAKSGWKRLAAGTFGLRAISALAHRSKAHEVSAPRTAVSAVSENEVTRTVSEVTQKAKGLARMAMGIVKEQASAALMKASEKAKRIMGIVGRETLIAKLGPDLNSLDPIGVGEQPSQNQDKAAEVPTEAAAENASHAMGITGQMHRHCRNKFQHMLRNDVVRAALLYAVVIAVLFGSVVFLGRSVQAPLYYPYGLVETGPYGYESRMPVNTFNVELASPAYYEWTANVQVGQLYRQGELPLWNPNQAAGMPLAAQYSSRVFFPYQIAEDISPNWTWDFFMLGRLWVAGLFTFLFLRLLGLSWISSFLGGIFYMFSGTFVWFINLEQYVNVAMVTPVLLWTLEGLWRWRWKRGAVGVAVGVALVLLAGQPETALYVLLLGAAYVAFRVAGTAPQQRRRMLALALLGSTLGLALAAPLVVPFLEFMPLSHSIHPSGGTIGVQDPTPLFDLPQMFIPTYYEMPTWYRYFPDNGHWDYVGGYIGVLLPFLILVGGTLGFLQVQSRWRNLFLFFTIFGVLLLLKNFGSPLVLWIGRLPLFDVSWNQRWAGCCWTFPLAVAGALALEIIRDQAHGAKLRERVSRWWQRLRPLLLIICGYTGIILGILGISYLISHYDTLNMEELEYFTPSVLMGVLVALLVIFTAIFITRHYLRTRIGIWAFVALALVELWFAIPRGYEPASAMLKIIPFTIGLIVALAITYRRQLQPVIGRLISHKRTTAVFAVLVFLTPTLIIDVNADHGFPQRYDAATPPPYVDYLNSQEGYYRVTGGDGVLFPNFASTVGLLDVRYIAALSVDSYQNFKDRNLHVDWLWAPEGTSIWFTGGQERRVVNQNGSYGRINRSFWEDIEGKLPFYSLLGVKYILAPDYRVVTVHENWLLNGALDSWSRGPGPFTQDDDTWADGWDIDLYGGASISVSHELTDIGGEAKDSAKITYTHGTAPSFARQLFVEDDMSSLLGKTLTLSIWVKTSTPNAVRVGISGAGTGTTWSRYHPGDNKWLRLDVIHTIPASGATAVVALIDLGASATVYVADATLIEAAPPVIRLEGPFPLVYDNEIKIYENPDVLPRAFVVHEVELTDSLAEAQKVIRHPGFDLRHKVVLEEPLPDDFDLVPGANSMASIVDYRANRVVVEAELEQPGILMLTDVFYPGWRATVDGEPAKIYRVDGVFRGVLLQEGSHTIVFSYFPRSFIIGLCFAGISFLICSWLFISPRWRPRPRGNRTEEE